MKSRKGPGFLSEPMVPFASDLTLGDGRGHRELRRERTHVHLPSSRTLFQPPLHTPVMLQSPAMLQSRGSPPVLTSQAYPTPKPSLSTPHMRRILKAVSGKLVSEILCTLCAPGHSPRDPGGPATMCQAPSTDPGRRGSPFLIVVAADLTLPFGTSHTRNLV